MNENIATPTTVLPLTLVGDAAEVCVGDSCAVEQHDVPTHPEQALINEALDNDMV